jgi:hypothetical protein
MSVPNATISRDRYLTITGPPPKFHGTDALVPTTL